MRFPSLGQCESALSRFELSMFGYKEKRIPWNTPPENKKSWAQACLCSDDEDRISWKDEKWGYNRIQVPENGPVRHLYPRWCQGPLACRHSRICTLGLTHQCGGSLLLCLFLSVSLCLVEKSTPRRGWHWPRSSCHARHRHRLRSASRLTAVGVGSFPSPMSYGW